MLDIRKGKPGERGQGRAKNQQRAEVVTRSDPAHDQGKQRGSQQRHRRHDADRNGIVAKRGHVGRQDDDGKTVAEPAQAACGVEQGNERGLLLHVRLVHEAGAFSRKLVRFESGGYGNGVIEMASKRLTLSALVQSATPPASVKVPSVALKSVLPSWEIVKRSPSARRPSRCHSFGVTRKSAPPSCSRRPCTTR